MVFGAVTDENSRELSVKMDFLEPGKKYSATLYLDALMPIGIRTLGIRDKENRG